MKMITNLHTHTFRCRHASGREREYIENAIAGGLTTLGFADHVPYPFPNGYQSGFRMLCNEMDDYVDTLLALREEYKDRIDIKIGYEAEYYPKYFDDMLKLITSREVDYIINGQHFLDNEIGSMHTGRTDSEAILAKYVDQVIEALGTGVFTYAAHPDNMHFIGDEKIFDKHYTRLIEFAKSKDIPLEINLLGIRDHRKYPHERFVQLCGEIGAEVCIGSDAHSANVTVDPKSFDIAVEWAEKYGAKVNLNPTLREVRN